MELILINERKLKIMLSGDDMIRYDLCGLNGSMIGQDINHCFGEMLRDVRGRIGFCAEGERLCMQYYPCRDGGGELYITKLDEPSATAALTPNTSLNKKDTDTPAQESFEVAFDNISDMLAACRAISSIGADLPAATAYISKKAGDTSLLVLSQKPKPRLLVLLSEFGSFICARQTPLDRYTAIADGDAVEVLSKL